MLVIGFALAFSSTFLVKPAQARFDKRQIIRATLAMMLVCALAFALSPVALLCFVPVFFFYFLFGAAYPTILGIFSSCVSEKDQGWIMGVTTAVFCLAGGIMSLIGGGLMSIGIRLPFYIVAVAALCGLVAMYLTWRDQAVRRLMARPAQT
jgi:predicted MFS family arabinose efflux permease